MSALINPLIQEFLNLLEGKEIKLLTWGIVDGGFAEEEIAEMAAELLSNNEPDVDIWDFINEILERRLLFELNLRGRRLFRTRMSEAVRLFARLRQLFPNNIRAIAAID